MKKKIVIGIIVLVIAALIFGVGEIAGMFPWQYLKESEVEAFLADSQYTFAYALPDEAAKGGYNSILTGDLAAQMAAVTYAARSGFALDTDGDAYVITAEELTGEESSLFLDAADGEAADSALLTAADGGYRLHLNGVSTAGLTYEITDSFYGLIGSEPTYITVRYTLNGEQCTLQYSLTSDKASPYTFRVGDITIVE